MPSGIYTRTAYHGRSISAAKIGKFTNEDNPNWKGDDVGYRAIHMWVERKLGKATHCSNCTNTGYKRYHWANISKQYRRDLTDWIQLCPYCHKQFDLTGKLPKWD